MKFGPIALDKARGAVLAHSVEVGGRRFRKAHVLSESDIEAFRAAGFREVIAAVLEPTDLGEDAAASRIVESMVMDHVDAKPASTGRVNLHAAGSGVFVVDAGLVNAVNAIDPAITLATLADKVAVQKGQMVATVKIIPFAVDGALVERAASVVARGRTIAVRPYEPRRVGLIQTVLPGIKDSVLAKTVRVTEARLERSGSRLTGECRVAHAADAVAAALAEALADNDMAIVFGASALCDFDDVIPSAIRAAGGTVIRAGMPVDPGNLLVLGEIGGKTVIGAPGCARSPKENGFDWVLDRLVAGLDVTSDDIAAMGVGGLLMEIPTRPLPREATRAASDAEVHVVLLAAGRSSRMGGPNKLLALFDGVPLVRRVAEQAVASRAKSVTVVTGHQQDRVTAALAGLDLTFVHNAEFAAGLSGSLKTGIDGLPGDAAGALVVLGDMPAIETRHLDMMIDRFAAAGASEVVRATHDGKRGNPVLLPRAVFEAVAGLKGDTGARHLVEGEGLGVIDVEIGQGASLDVDTAEALAGAGGVLQG